MNTAKIELLIGAVIFSLVFWFAGCSKAPTDSSVADTMKSSFYSDPQLKNDRVEVSVSHGEVTLAGEVSSESVRAQALKLANQTSGVRKVSDMMQVKPAAVVERQASQSLAALPRFSTVPARTSKPKPKVTSLPPAQFGAEPGPSQSPALLEPEPPAPPPEQPISPAPPPPPPPPPPRRVTVPAGTSVRIQMMDSVDSSTDRVGQRFHASLQAPIVVGDEVIVPKGVDVVVKLTEASQAGKIQGRSELQLELDRLQFQGKSYALTSTIYEQKGESRGVDTAKKVGLGTAIGAAIGAIAGGGKGAAIGAGAGAGAGTAAQVFLKGKQVKIPSETRLDFALEQPVEFSLSPKDKPSGNSDSGPN
jgi:BON domain-containing protein